LQLEWAYPCITFQVFQLSNSMINEIILSHCSDEWMLQRLDAFTEWIMGVVIMIGGKYQLLRLNLIWIKHSQ